MDAYSVASYQSGRISAIYWTGELEKVRLLQGNNSFRLYYKMFTLVFISDEEVYEVYLLSPKYKDCNIDFCMIVS